MSRYVYPAILEPEGSLYNVSFPDLPTCYTCGDDLADAVYMAGDALSGYLSRLEENGMAPAAPSPLGVLSADGCVITLIFADTDAYRRLNSTKSVKKTLTIPEWLNNAAEARGINFSQVLQEALRAKLNV